MNLDLDRARCHWVAHIAGLMRDVQCVGEGPLHIIPVLGYGEDGGASIRAARRARVLHSDRPGPCPRYIRLGLHHGNMHQERGECKYDEE